MQPVAAPSDGTPWAHGPGRPKDIPETAVILNQRIITRESLDSSVPTGSILKHVPTQARIATRYAYYM